MIYTTSITVKTYYPHLFFFWKFHKCAMHIVKILFHSFPPAVSGIFPHFPIFHQIHVLFLIIHQIQYCCQLNLPLFLKTCSLVTKMGRFNKCCSMPVNASLIKGSPLMITKGMLPKSRLIRFPYFFTNWKTFQLS